MTRDDDAAHELLAASRDLLGITLRAVASAPVALTVPQHRLLVLVAEDGPRRVGALATDLGVNQSNASRLVDRLVGQGLLSRAPDPDDRRASVVTLSDTGREVVDHVTAARLEALRALVADLSPAQRERLAVALRPLNHTAEQ